MIHWTEGLNPEQKEAVLHNNGPLLILAGAGSGKTTVLVSRSGRLIDEKKVSASELCVLTFTNKAARELKHRVSNKLGSAAAGIWAGTFHSFGLQILRRFHKTAGLPSHFGILDPGDLQSLIKELLKDFHLSTRASFDSDRLYNFLGELRENGRIKGSPGEDYETAAEWLLPRFLKRMEHLGCVDFDGLILKPIELFENNPSLLAQIQNQWQQIMVDEFQDTNKSQMKLIDLISSKSNNITVVGDDDQSIYGWRGACVNNILDFPTTHKGCKVIRLERNYRSTPAILQLANTVIAKNEKRHGKKLRPDPDANFGDTPEIFVFENEEEEARRIVEEIRQGIQNGFDPSQIALLYRSNGQGALFEAELRVARIPYKISGGSAFFDRKEIRDVLAYLKCGIYLNDLSLRRIINCPPRGLGETTLEKLSAWATTQNSNFSAAVKNWRQSGVPEKTGATIDQLLHFLRDLPKQILADSSGSSTVGSRLLEALDKIGYKEYVIQLGQSQLGSENSQNNSGGKKWELLQTFAGVLDSFVSQGGAKVETLKEFVDSMELRDAPESSEENSSAISLMTLHSCKGLEFPMVFIAGIEEDLLPHRTLGQDISEERRLFYVGVTRAKRKLILTRAKSRRRFGRPAESAPSRFLLEIPSEQIVEHALGHRPVNEVGRKALMADLFKKIDSRKST